MSLLLIASILAATLATSQQEKTPIQVMVLGTYHFDNPNQDLVNLQAEDVLEAKRQRELEQVAEGLARFKPNKILLERLAKQHDLTDPNYATFALADLGKVRDERVQIGYRLAARLGLERVFAIDEQPSAGEPDYFPMDKVIEYAKSNGKGEQLNHMIEQVQRQVTQLQEKQKSHTIGEVLTDMNDPKGFSGKIDPYYQLLSIGDSEQQPGADLNAMWYLRNAKIFGKLITVAKPGDRLLVLFGSGHCFWLRHFATNTPGFANVDPRPYLRTR